MSVIVPALNEATCIAEALRAARQPGVREIIVVDGGSTDSTCAQAVPLADVVLSAPRGRALQMNAGAARAEGEILLFLHADTRVPEGYAADVIDACHDPAVVGGRFDVDLQPSSPLLRITANLINARSRLTRISTGDQAIFVRRDQFERLGGYAPIPLMEDVEFSRRLKRAGAVAALKRRVTTSARRWTKDGVMRTILLMWSLRLRYFLGASPADLQRLYQDRR